MTPSECRLRLRKLGYVPIPVAGKKPVIESWQKRVDASPGDIEVWSQLFSDARNTGILTARTPAIDIDILDSAAAESAELAVRERFEERGDIHVRFGRSPKRAIFFRTTQPFDKIQVPLIAPIGDTTQKIEFLGRGQQVVVDGTHPGTGQPYTWFGGPLCEANRDSLPDINEALAWELVDAIADILVAEHGYQRARQRPKPRAGSGADVDPGGAADWQHLIGNIIAGNALHDSLRDLAAKLVKCGTSAGSAVNQMRAWMEASTASHDERWRERYADIPRLVESAEQFREPAPPLPGPASEPKKAADCLAMLDVAAWDGVPVPARDWAVRDRIVRRAVTLLSGEGGVGKSILIMQLACAHALERDWFGSLPEPGPVIYLNAEDDQRELHFRLEAIRAHLGTTFAALKDLHLVPLAGENALLGVPDRTGIIRPTPLFDRLLQTAAKLQPIMMALDTAADGRVEVDGEAFGNAREAATSIYGKKTGGWWFFLTEPASGRTLRTVRRDYIEAMAVDSDDDDQGDDDDDDEA